ncbi:DUF732 domain-containing protein [Mycobacterium sp. 1423905.2]|jgi:hypothetical protein|uniref:DUF732 domain-containing protein n=1 Tax=Mycobacterium sp. 1423905.2 TaxID=1856859 RepID=UPI000800E08F|nr:DUF732 domain-containing protein [Mycobacterium sp. 1423905.2]OBJ53768.1 hypothetical protein A9W95_17945 [Mycobacterium sp. 1423905.2]
MRLLLPLAVASALTALAAPASADSTDDLFLASLRAAGISFQDPDRAVRAGKFVCALVDQGQRGKEVVDTVQSQNPAVDQEGAAKFTAIAAHAYCPKAIAGLS